MSTAQESADKIAAVLSQAAEVIAPEVANIEAQVAAGERPDLGPAMVAAEAVEEILDVVEEIPGEIVMEDSTPVDPMMGS